MRAIRSDDGTDSGSARHESVPRIETVLSLHEKTERSLDDHQRFVERVVARIGRPRTIYTLFVAVVVWGLVNEAMPRLFGRRPFDEPPFFWLQGILALYAALVTTMVLTTQNRSQKACSHRVVAPADATVAKLACRLRLDYRRRRPGDSLSLAQQSLFRG